ncbi:hypothetical protein [Clostridium saccharobutylicum]|uniref:Uncharacterized protein n=1 Tax=Clostridium saccharobutylicum TaxID=169679 RepID=A0A1S8N569_CLOSA|nr:hypothetical protein [Clostridium saccharobutylicum]OOM11666.1 hypothetical protein CLOSAC_20930 [Clostridium saccharobutylicum]
MKRTMSIVVITFFILLIWGAIRDSKKVKLYSGLNVDSITYVGIHTPFAGFGTDDKNEILEITQDLKELTFYKDSNLMPANNTPDAWIVLEGKNDVIIDRVVVYGNFATHSKDENKYEFDYSNLDKLCEKYK